jgi:glyoxylate reductase
MKKPSIFVTREIPELGLDILSESCDLVVNRDEFTLNKHQLSKNIKQKDGLLCMLSDRIDKEVLEEAEDLKVISSFSVGVNHIDTSEATRLGIYVTYTPGVLTEATADLTFALLLATARRIVESDNYIRTGKWKVGWSPKLLLGKELSGKKLGIIGLGRIGKAVARRALGFNMKILYHNRTRCLKEEKEMNVEFRTLKNLLEESDFISIHVPLTDKTINLIKEDSFNIMKKDSIIINTSRGEIIEENALIRALENRLIAGAGLDVFSKEPLLMNSKLLELEYIVLSPHIGSATHETRNRMAEISAKNLIAVLKGVKPPHLFNKEVMTVRPLSKTKMF